MKKTIFILFVTLILIFISISVNAVYEDFTTYTEVDPNNHLSQTTSTATSTGITNNESAYLYKDKGVGHFGDYEFLFHSKITSVTDRGGLGIWGISNDLTSFESWSSGQVVYCSPTTGSLQTTWTFREYGVTDTHTTGAENINQDRYFTVKRVGTVGTCKIYSDSARQNLIFDLSITTSETTLRYIYGCTSRNLALDRECDSFTKDLDLQDLPPNYAPTVNLYLPLNNSVDIDPIPNLYANVTDLDGNIMNLTWYSNSSGSWIIFGSNLSINNGTYHQYNNNFSVYGTTYYWNCSVNDGTDFNNSEIFHFTTKIINVPTVNLYLPLNNSVDIDPIPNLYTNVTDLDGNIMNLTWYSNSSGSWIIFGSNLSINNGTYHQYNNNFSVYGTTYYWNCSVNDGTDFNSSEIFHFSTKIDSVTITRVSYSPENIRINNTDYMDILFNITTEGTPINHTSLLFAHTVNQTLAGYGLNFTYRILKDSVELRADNRNEGRWFEQFNASGTGELGYHGQWGVHDNSSVKFIYVDSGSNWTTVRFNGTTTLVPHMFSNVWYIDRTDLQDENKTSQIFNIYENNVYKAKFNMTDTNFYNDPQYNNSLYQFYYNANDTGTPNKPLKIYLANESYVSGKPSTSVYCVLIDERLDNDVADYSIRNSSYWGCNFSTNATGYVGSLKMTELFYFIFETKAGNINNKFDLAFCDSNVSNRDFNNSDFTEYSPNNGNSWSIQNGSIDCHFKYAKLDDSSRIDYKVYAQDTSDNSVWSIIYTDLIDIINVHPNPANILTQNGTIMSYNIGDIINITYKWIGDPNQDTCYVNTTCHDSLHNIVAYIENRSITHLEVEINLTWWINWNTSNVPIGNEYYINIVITDIYGLSTISKSSGIFNLTSIVNFYFTSRFPLNNTENISISRWMYCSCNVSNDINNTMNISFYLSETGLIESYYLLYKFENKSNGFYSVYANENYPIIYNTTYYWYLHSEIYNNNIYNNQSDIFKFTTIIEGGDNIIGIVNSQWILIVTSILFGFFFYVGYKSDKSSGGFLLMISGFTMLYLQTILPLSPIFIIPILSIFSLYIILMGIYKWLYVKEKKDE